MASILKRIQSLEMSKDRQESRHIWIDNLTSTIVSPPPDKPKIYIPSKTGEQFHSDDTFIRLVMGPYNSGKSTMCIQEIVRRAISMPVWYKGRRKSRWVIIRNTSAELKSTTLKTWMNWFEGLGDYKKREKPLLVYEYIFNDGKGLVELELIFLALDRPEDIKKLKSLEATGAYINEASELPGAIMDHLVGRVNKRYPPIDFCSDDYWCGIIADTNPPDEDHYIYKDFEENPSASYKIFHQPKGLLADENGNWKPNPDADNYKHMDKDYYVRLAEKKDKEFVKVYCLGDYGIVGNNRVVYPEYNDDLHSCHNLKAIQGIPIHLGWDGGLTPACVVVQISPKGQLLVLKEYCAEYMGIRTFAESIVIPSLVKDFPYNKIELSEADPSCKNRSEIMEELSFIGELINLGIPTNPAFTNDPETRMASVRFFLTRMVDAKPAFMLSREGCPTLRKGFIKNYFYKRLAVIGEERYRDVAEKNMASHSQDGLQYICLKLAPINISKEKREKSTADMFNPIHRYF